MHNRGLYVQTENESTMENRYSRGVDEARAGESKTSGRTGSRD